MSFHPHGRRQADDGMDTNAMRLRTLELQSEPEWEQEKTFLDLADDNFIEIMKYLDPSSRRKLRINKRLDKAYLCVKNNMEKIKLETNDEGGYRIRLTPSNRRMSFLYYGFTRLTNGLHRLALNTQFQTISYRTSISIEQNRRVIDALSNFNADQLTVWCREANFNLHQVNLSSLLKFAQNLTKVTISVISTSSDFPALRKIMLEGGCKLESFTIKVEDGFDVAFLKEYFGVTFETSNNNYQSRIYRTTDESVELFRHPHHRFYSILYHYEGEIETQVGGNLFSLEKYNGGAKPDVNYVKIRMNHLYLS